MTVLIKHMQIARTRSRDAPIRRLPKKRRRRQWRQPLLVGSIDEHLTWHPKDSLFSFFQPVLYQLLSTFYLGTRNKTARFEWYIADPNQALTWNPQLTKSLNDDHLLAPFCPRNPLVRRKRKLQKQLSLVLHSRVFLKIGCLHLTWNPNDGNDDIDSSLLFSHMGWKFWNVDFGWWFFLVQSLYVKMMICSLFLPKLTGYRF